MNDNFDFSFTGISQGALDQNMQNLAHQANDLMLPDDMVINAVTYACEFFGIPEVPVINAQGTCVWPNDSTTFDDDVFGFNREELMSLGVSGEDSLTLIYTHECAHRTLQATYTDDWEEELACDFFAGIHAGMKGMNIDNFEASLGQTSGSDSHPNGALRADFIEYGKQVAEEMQARGVEITYEGCIARLNQHLEDKGGLIDEYRERFCSNGLVGDENAVISKGVKGAFNNPYSSGFDKDHPMPTYDQLRNAGFSEYLANQILHGTHSYSDKELFNVLYSEDPVNAYNQMMEAKVNAALERSDILIDEIHKEFGI